MALTCIVIVKHVADSFVKWPCNLRYLLTGGDITDFCREIRQSILLPTLHLNFILMSVFLEILGQIVPKTTNFGHVWPFYYPFILIPPHHFRLAENLLPFFITLPLLIGTREYKEDVTNREHLRRVLNLPIICRKITGILAMCSLLQ